MKAFLKRYTIGFVIALFCLGGLIYNHLTYPEDFNDQPVVTIFSYLVVLAGNVALVIHARQWWVRIKSSK